MFSSNFYIFSIIFFLTYSYSEFFYSMLIHSTFKNLKVFSIELTKIKNILIYKNNSFVIVINLLLLLFITLKINLNNILFSFVFIYIFITKYINKYFDKYITFLNFSIISFCTIFFFINSYIIFYLFIELYAIIFYFFFLNINFNFKQIYLIQYKNSLLLYLVNNFLTSILYLIGLNYIINYYGTVNFYELNFFNFLRID